MPLYAHAWDGPPCGHGGVARDRWQGFQRRARAIVTLTMVITTILAYFLVRHVWGWSIPKAAAVSLIFLAPEVVFMGANAIKIEHGGWFPLVVGAAIFAMMLSWKRGREILSQRFREQLLPLTDFFDLMHVDIPARVPGTAVFMVSSRAGTPPAMLHNFMH